VAGLGSDSDYDSRVAYRFRNYAPTGTTTLVSGSPGTALPFSPFTLLPFFLLLLREAEKIFEKWGYSGPAFDGFDPAASHIADFM
jgi:hypothetical protein